MPPELIEKMFNDKVLWRFNSIEPVSPEQEVRLKIAFQEGVIAASDFLIEKFNKVIQ